MPSSFPLGPVLSLACGLSVRTAMTMAARILTSAVALSVLSYSMQLHAPRVVIAVAGIVVVHAIVIDNEAEMPHSSLRH